MICSFVLKNQVQDNIFRLSITAGEGSVKQKEVFIGAELKGTAGKVFQSVGVALPQSEGIILYVFLIINKLILSRK